MLYSNFGQNRIIGLSPPIVFVLKKYKNVCTPNGFKKIRYEQKDQHFSNFRLIFPFYFES